MTCAEKGKTKPATLRVVVQDKHESFDCCNGCGLAKVSSLRDDRGSVVTLMSIRDGALVLPTPYVAPKSSDATPETSTPDATQQAA